MKIHNPSFQSTVATYLHLVKIRLIDLWAYKFEFIADFIRLPITISFYLLLYLYLYSQKTIINGYTTVEGLSYIIIVSLVFTGFTGQHMSHVINSDIISGAIVPYLVRPINFPMYSLVSQIAYRIYFLVIASVGYGLVSYFFPQYLVLPDILHFIIFAAFIFLAFFVSIQFFMLLGILSFWMKDVNFLNRMLRTLQDLLGGRYFPIQWFPPALLLISTYLPFSLLYAVPANFLIGKISLSQISVYFAVALGWFIVLYYLTQKLFERGLLLFDGAGN